jgi:cysteine desulfurase
MIFFIKRVYLDHNATTPIHPDVANFIARNMRKIHGNASSLHTVGRQAKYLVEEAREKIAAALGCNPGTVYFTSGGTEGNNTILKGVFAKHDFKGTLITSAMEHESILGAAQQLEGHGVKVIRLSDVSQVERVLSDDTRLVSIMHGNNETGIVNDIENIGKLCKARGILFHADAVQSFGKILVVPEKIGCDFLTISSHKINGPKGCGALYIRDLSTLEALIYGGDQEHTLRAGTENVHSIAGFGEATRLRMESMNEDYEYMQIWRQKFISELREIYPGVKVNEASMQLPGTMSLTFPGESNLKLLAALDCYGVEISNGSACTADRIVPSHVLLGMGYDEQYALSTIRVSISASNSMADLRYVLKVFREIRTQKLDSFAYLMPEHLTPERLKSAYLIDIRWPYERILRQSLPQAHEVNVLRFEAWSKTIPREREIIIMCSTGVISGLNGYKLAHKGYDVKVLYGGYEALPL